MGQLKRNENGFIIKKVRKMIEWNEQNGEGCIVSDMISKDGWKVGYMYRDEPMPNYPDSGWHFYKGDEDENYSNDSNNFHVFALNTLCNYDPDVISYLHLPIGTVLIRAKDGKFIIDEGTQPIVFERQDENDER